MLIQEEAKSINYRWVNKIMKYSSKRKLRSPVVSQKHGMQSGHHAIIFCLILQEKWMISIYLVKSQSHLLKKKTDKLNQPIRLQNHLIRKSTTQPWLWINFVVVLSEIGLANLIYGANNRLSVRQHVKSRLLQHQK